MWIVSMEIKRAKHLGGFLFEINIAQSAGAVEYTDCFSAEG